MHLHRSICIAVNRAKGDLLKRARLRMAEERLDQRALAVRLHTTQGHLSKILRGRYTRDSRVVRALEDFVAQRGTSRAEEQYTASCLRVARRSDRHMQLMTVVVQCVEQLSDLGAASNVDSLNRGRESLPATTRASRPRGSVRAKSGGTRRRSSAVGRRG